MGGGRTKKNRRGIPGGRVPHFKWAERLTALASCKAGWRPRRHGRLNFRGLLLRRTSIVARALCAGRCVLRRCLGAVGGLLSAVGGLLRLLRSLGLVKYRKEGRLVYYSLTDEHTRHLLWDVLEHLQGGEH